MAEVNILKFVTDNIFLVAVAFVSGAMLVWPAVRRGASGASISTLQATLLINQQNALVLDVREAAEEEFAWSFAGRHRLKGVKEPVPLYRARRPEAAPEQPPPKRRKEDRRRKRASR